MQTKNYLFLLFAITYAGFLVASEQVVTVPNETTLRSLIGQHWHLNNNDLFRESAVREFAGKTMTLTALIKIVNKKPIASRWVPFNSAKFYDKRPGRVYTYPEIQTSFLADAGPEIYAVLLNNNPQLLEAKEQALRALNSEFRNCTPYR